MAAHAANCPAWPVTARTVRRHGHLQCGRMISRPLKHVARRSGRGTPPKAVSALSLAGRHPTSRGDYVSKVAPPLPSLSFHQRGLASGPKPRNRAYLTLAHRQVIATCLPCVNCPPGRGPHARSHPPLVIPTLAQSCEMRHMWRRLTCVVPSSAGPHLQTCGQAARAA